MGWLATNSSGWAVVAEKPLVLEHYTYDGKDYFKVPNESKYMSVDRNGFVGFYAWAGASTFHQDGQRLVSDYNQGKLCLNTDGAGVGIRSGTESKDWGNTFWGYDLRCQTEGDARSTLPSFLCDGEESERTYRAE